MKIEFQNKIIFKVTANTDDNEGRGNPFIVGYFIDEDRATEDCNKYQTGRITSESITVVVCDNGYVYMLGEQVNMTAELDSVIKTRALAKLSDKERKVLGIK